MLVICSLLITVNAGGVGWQTKADTEGKILKESPDNYLVDFSEGVKEYRLMGKPSDYKKVLVKKTDCVKE